jgi:hypothetical protein
MKGVPPITTRVQVPQSVAAGTTAGVHSDTQSSAPNKPSGTLKSKAKGAGSESVPASSIEAAPRRTSVGTSGSAFEPLSVAPIVTTSSTAKVDKRLPPEE